MSEIEEMGRFEQGVWIPQQVLREPSGNSWLGEVSYPTMQDNIWMIMVRLEQIESHLFRLEQLLNTIDSDIRWRR
jgi:hypothetical protein